MATLFLDATEYLKKPTMTDGTLETMVNGAAHAQGDNIRRLFENKVIPANHTVVVRCKEGTITNPEWDWIGEPLTTLEHLPENPYGGIDPDYTIAVRFSGFLDR